MNALYGVIGFSKVSGKVEFQGETHVAIPKITILHLLFLVGYVFSGIPLRDLKWHKTLLYSTTQSILHVFRGYNHINLSVPF